MKTRRASSLSRRRLAFAAALCLAGGGAGATSPEFDEPEICSRENFGACLNGAASPVTNAAGLRASLGAHDEVARDRRKARRGEATAGLGRREAWFAAGDAAAAPIGLWVSYNYTDAASDFAVLGTSLAFESDAHGVLAGVDRMFGDRVLLGIAGGYTDVSADTFYNGGGQDNDGYTFAPYAAVLLNEIFSIDVNGGYSALDYDQHRISPTDGTNTSAGFDADRWFIAGNVNASLQRNNWFGNLRVGAAHAAESQDAYTEAGSAASQLGGTLRAVQDREIDLTQLIVGGEVAYSAAMVEPYFTVAYHNDLSRDDDAGAGGLPGAFTVVQPSDDDEVQIGLGLRCYTTRGITATLEYLRVEGREAFDSESLMATLRLAL